MSVQLNKREKFIALAALALVALFLGDRAIVAPALAYRAQLVSAAEQEASARHRAERLQHNLPRLERQWADLRAAGLDDSASDAEARLLRALRTWADESGLGLSALVPDRVEAHDRLPRIHVRLTGVGHMRQIADMLHRLEIADIPVRVHEAQLGARRDESEELTLQLRVSTLHVAPRRSDHRPAPLGSPRRPRP